MGLMGFVNLAHGLFAMLGGYIAVSFIREWAAPFLPAALPLACVAVALISIVLGARSVPPPLRRRRAPAGSPDHRPGVHGHRRVHLHLGAAERAARCPLLSQGPGGPGFPALSHLPHVHHAGELRRRSSASGTGSSARCWVPRCGPRWTTSAWPRPSASTSGGCSRLTFALGSALAALGGRTGYGDPRTDPHVRVGVPGLLSYRGGRGRSGESARAPSLAALILGVVDTAGKYYLPAFGAFFIFAVTIVLLLWRPQGFYAR